MKHIVEPLFVRHCILVRYCFLFYVSVSGTPSKSRLCPELSQGPVLLQENLPMRRASSTALNKRCLK